MIKIHSLLSLGQIYELIDWCDTMCVGYVTIEESFNVKNETINIENWRSFLKNVEQSNIDNYENFKVPVVFTFADINDAVLFKMTW